MIKRYDTVKLIRWNEGVYMTNLRTGKETVYKAMNMDTVIRAFNIHGFFVSACHQPDMIGAIIYMTREIEEEE